MCAALANDSVVIGAGGKTRSERFTTIPPDAGVLGVLVPARVHVRPKKHLECDEHAIREQARYLRDNLARMTANAAGRGGIDRTAFTEAEQFRP